MCHDKLTSPHILLHSYIILQALLSRAVCLNCVLITGNIRVCTGCRQRYPKPPQPPFDLCVRPQEWQKFVPTGTYRKFIHTSKIWQCILSCEHSDKMPFRHPCNSCCRCSPAASCSHRTYCGTYASLLTMTTPLLAHTDNNLVYPCFTCLYFFVVVVSFFSLP